MAEIEFQTETHEGFTLITFNLQGAITPEVLAGLEEVVPQVPLNNGVVLSGRGPVWLYGWLIHHFHPASWVENTVFLVEK